MAGSIKAAEVSGPQLGKFSYFKFNPAVHSREKPYEILINLPPRAPGEPLIRRHNQEFEDHHVTVNDMRGREDSFSLDENGFCWKIWEGPSEWKEMDAKGVKNLSDNDIQRGYILEAEQYLKEELERQDGREVDIVRVFDYRLREYLDPESFQSRTLDLDDGRDPLLPVPHPHVDQTRQGATLRVKDSMPDQADDLLGRRFRIVNLWRPLKTVRNWPLAICDSKSVDVADLVPNDLVRRRYVGESYYATFNTNHRWCYLSSQKTNEVTLLKIFDSDPQAPTQFSLHSSFGLEVQDQSRESFEIRALVFDKPN
ncbi:hypothetical protein HG530_006756 [Fusarium avenaceum]|nr:hypothetical protein DER45DRAFT_534262 [Fusarium avenaceum]KAI6765686.1 hypothetical protein HG530_006756 [Fusarium avenaceum]